MFAVIKTGGKQYKVAADELVKIERLEGETGESVAFENVLMLGGDDGVTVGAPYVDGATVAGEIVDQGRGRKIIIFKKRRRQNSRRKNGHRQYFTTVKITDILTGGAKPDTSVKKATAAVAGSADEPTQDTAAPAALFSAPVGEPDDLKKISGVGPVLETKLNALGITKFAQVAAFTAEDIANVDDALSFKGRIDRDNWLEQAAQLAKDVS